MRPLRLRMQNFMSYADADINLASVSLASITGPNGSGKSTILQAITYALWGEVRTPSHNDVVKRGTTMCAVSLTFKVGDETYCVLRRRDISGRGSSDLEFSINVSATEGKTLTRPTIRETQAAINEVVGLSYDVFVNSALLQQGDSSRFSNARPAQRKELLAQMLNLGELAEIEKTARAQHKGIQLAVHTTTTLLEDCIEDFAELDHAEQNLSIARTEASMITKEIEQAEKGIKSLEANLLSVKLLHSSYDAAGDRLQDLRDAIEVIDAEQRALQIKIERLGSLLDDKEEIEKTKAEWDKLQDTMADLEAAREAYLRAEQLRAKIEVEATSYRSAGMLQLREERLAEFVVDKKRVSDRIDAIGLDLLVTEKSLDGVHERLSVERIVLSEEAEMAAVAASEVIQLRRNLKRIIDTDECPLCDQYVDAVSSGIVEDIELKIETQSAIKRNCEHGISTGESNIAGMEEEVARLDKKKLVLIREKMKAEETFITATVNITDGKTDVEEAREHARILKEGDFAHELHQELVEISPLADEHLDSTYRKAMSDASKLGRIDLVYQKLELAQVQYEETEDAWDSKRKQAERKCEEIAEQEKIVAEYALKIEHVEIPDDLQSKIDEGKYHTKELQRHLDNAAKEIGEAEANLKRRESLRKKEKELQSKIGLLNEEADVAELLVKAASKTGAQALLIESVLPALEKDANEYLSAMSPGTQIALESQRMTQKGSASETLDIRVYHNGKDAPIESLSGGERFRADLALRLAIGRMLSRRSGTQIRSLFIDEGFGTQDTDGQEAVVSAITKISGLFDLVLLITHIPQVSETIEQRIIVTKSGGNSQVEVVDGY